MSETGMTHHTHPGATDERHSRSGPAAAAHTGHDAHDAHGGHDKHAGHDPEMFRRKFWLSLVADRADRGDQRRW